MAVFIPRAGFRAFSTVPKVAPISRVSRVSQIPAGQPIIRRFLATTPQEQPRLRLGSTGMSSEYGYGL